MQNDKSVLRVKPMFCDARSRNEAKIDFGLEDVFTLYNASNIVFIMKKLHDSYLFSD